MSGEAPATYFSRLIILVIALTVHEFAHAWTADQLGDSTPRSEGRLTLNPLSHLDPLGSLAFILVGFGWARPVRINYYNLHARSPAAPMLVAAAGPLSNLLLAVLAAIPFRMGLAQIAAGTGLLPNLNSFLTEFVWLNLILLFFNLIPVAPLDGEKVLTYFLPSGAQSSWMQLRQYGPFILMALIFIGPAVGLNLLGVLVGAPTRFVFEALLL